MNVTNHNINFSKTLIATTVASVLLAACATAPVQPAGAAEVRSRLTQLQADPNLGSRAPIAIKEAEVAVRVAEQPQADEQLAQHRVYMADRKVETARAQAETHFAEDQRPALSQQRESARLDSRTREADAARTQVAVARADSAEQKLAADEARDAANAAQVAATSSERQAAELQRQIDELNAKPTDRGLVVTLGDVLFTSGQADLKAGAAGNLNKLVAFLNEYPSRTVMIEGHTDSVGSDDYNQGLSQRRAESVKTYLVTQGIGSVRLVAAGRGESAPVAGNDSAAGRQQNRHGAGPANVRVSMAACRVDRYLTRELHKVPGLEAVSVSAGYRLCGTDENGCNWSGDVVPMYGVRAPCADIIAAALGPIVKAAQARFNLGE